jgi:hypothetical protein
VADYCSILRVPPECRRPANQEGLAGGARRIGALAVAGRPLGRAQQVDALSSSHDLGPTDWRRAVCPPRESKDEVAGEGSTSKGLGERHSTGGSLTLG